MFSFMFKVANGEIPWMAEGGSEVLLCRVAWRQPSADDPFRILCRRCHLVPGWIRFYCPKTHACTASRHGRAVDLQHTTVIQTHEHHPLPLAHRHDFRVSPGPRAAFLLSE